MTKTQIDPEMNMTLDMDLLSGSMGIAYWFTTISDIPREFFAKYVKDKRFLDLGCGDGRVVSLAMRCGARASGIEIDEKFIQKSNMQRYIKKGDLCSIDLSKYEVLYYFLGSYGKGELILIENLKNFEGVLMIYHRKVSHHLHKFHDKLIEQGFSEIEDQDYLKVYRKEK